LARKTGASKQTVNAWLNRDTIQGYEYLMALRDKYGVTDEWILGKSGTMFTSAQLIEDEELMLVVL